MRVVVWMLVGAMIIPPSLLAQSLSNPALPSPPSGSSTGPSISNQLSPFLPFGTYGVPTPPGQAIVTNPTATQPIVPQHTPCPVPKAPDLSPENTVPDLNDYWPMAANSLLPASVEQRMRQEEEERDRLLERAQAEKDKRSLEHQTQVEREKKGLSQLPGLQSAIQGGMGGVQAQAAQAQAQANQQKMQLEQKPFMAEQLRHQDFSVEEAFAQFSVLQGVKSRLKQFGYDFFDAQAGGFTSLQDVPVGPDYVIGPQDSLAVHIWNVPDQNFNRSYIAPVERDGMVVIPQVGAIPVGGQTFSQAERTIHARLSMLLKRFELHVSMARIRTMKVYVVGEVARPGAYELSALATRPVNLRWSTGEALERAQVNLPLVRPPGRGASPHFDGARAAAAGLRYRPLSDTAAATLEWWRSQTPERRANAEDWPTEAQEKEALRLLASAA